MITKSVEEILTEASLAGGATIPTTPGGAECDPINLGQVGQFALTLAGVFDANATGSLSAHIRTSPDGTNWDTVDYTSFTLPANPGTVGQMTEPIWCDPYYAMVMVVNGGTRAVTSLAVTRTYQAMEPT